jgi:translation elongation factor P/translation initiation factor 5A
MEKNNIKVVSIDKENMIYSCNDGNDYPLLDGMENIAINELQKFIDKAKQTTLNILKQIEEDNG